LTLKAENYEKTEVPIAIRSDGLLQIFKVEK